MRESKASTPLDPPVNGGIVNRIKNHAFYLEEHRARIEKVWVDFEEYRRILSDLNRRCELLENTKRRKRRTEW